MKLKVKDMDIATGGTQIAILNEKDAQDLDLHHMDRIEILHNHKKTTAIVDIAESGKAVPKGKIGLFEETLAAIHAKEKSNVTIRLAPKPKSVTYIKKKLDGKRLNQKEINTIVDDIVENRLSDIELTSFVISSYSHGMDMREIADLTKAMTSKGDQLVFKRRPVVDLHSVGGVCGNRTTMIVVPILVAAGCIVPKTSSRAITSPAGTADTMEVFCPVALPIHKLKKIIDDVGGFIIWGGSVNLAPADDKIIQVEHPLSIDAEGQMLASIMAKKASVGSTHLLIEIPIGNGTKVKNREKAKDLSKHFATLGKMLKIKVKTIVTQGDQPVGRGIGPILESRDVLQVLHCDPNAPKDLLKKSILMAGEILEFAGKAKKGHGEKTADRILKSGAALGAMTRIVEAQGGKIPDIEKLKTAKTTYTFKANKNGKIKLLSNTSIAKIARVAGSPIDPDAGVYLHAHLGQLVKKGDSIMTIYARSEAKMQNAKDVLKQVDGIIVK